VGNGGNPYLYDPSGQYEDITRGSGDYLTGNEADLSAYIAFENTLGSTVNTYTFDTSPEDEQVIAKRIEDLGGGGFFGCAANVSSAIAGVGPFQNITPTQVPGTLEKELSRLPNGKIKTYTPPRSTN